MPMPLWVVITYIVCALLLAFVAYVAGYSVAARDVRVQIGRAHEQYHKGMYNFLLPYVIGVGENAQVVIPIRRVADFCGVRKHGA